MLISFGLQEEVQIVKMNGDGIPAVNMYCGNQTVFVCEKAVSNVSPWTHLPYRKYVDPIIKFYFVRFYFFTLLF